MSEAPFGPSDEQVRAYLDGEHGPPSDEVVGIIQDDLERSIRAASCCCEASPPEFGGNLPARDCPIHGEEAQ